MKQPKRSHCRLGVLLLVALSVQLQDCKCESKEYDWPDLGVLSGPAGKSQSAANLRILVSPQRRMTKNNYEIEYTNNTSSQPDMSHVMTSPGSASSYATHQTVSQIAPAGHQSQSSAYSALSASLATLKNRLNARSLTLSSPLPVDQSGSGQVSSLYQPAPSSYGAPSLQLDPQSATQHGAGQPQSQTTYLSVPSHADVSASGYSSQLVSPSQGSDNKTIVLAIPAKINFLTDHQSRRSGQQQITVMQQQQLGEQQARPDYSGKQIAVYSSAQADPSMDPSGGQILMRGEPALNPDSENHQYVIVNPSSSGQTNGGVEHQQQVQPVSVYSSSSSYKPAANCPRCQFVDDRSAQYELPSAERVGEVSQKHSDDAYYNYIYRRSRSRRSRRPSARKGTKYYSSSSTSSSASSEDEPVGANGGDSADARPISSRSYSSNESPYMRYYRSRQSSPSSELGPDPAGRSSHEPSQTRKYSAKETSSSYRRGKSSRELDGPDSDEETSYQQHPQDHPSRSSEYVMDNGRYPHESRSSPADDEESKPAYDEPEPEQYARDKGSNQQLAGPSSDQVNADHPNSDMQTEDGDVDAQKYLSRRRKSLKSRYRRVQGAKDYNKEQERYNKGQKKLKKGAKYSRQERLPNQNGTDFESTQPGDSHAPEHPNSNDEDAHAPKDSNEQEQAEYDKDGLSSKYKANLTDSAVANLSKTTMHLKEILSILEKKAYSSKVNETGPTPTSTPTPVTTTSLYPLSSLFGSSSYGSSSLGSSLSNDYLSGSDYSLKSPYRYLGALSSPLSSSSLSSLASTYSSLPDTLSSFPSYTSSHYGMPSKHMPYPGHPRKKRVQRPIRYTSPYNLPKSHAYGSPSSLMPASGKSAFLNPPYYSTLHHPYWYTRGSSPSVTNSYPYKNLGKSHYSPILNSMLRF